MNSRRLKRVGKTDKVRHQGESALGQIRGPNTGAWEKVYTGWRGREKYSRAWNSAYSKWGHNPW